VLLDGVAIGVRKPRKNEERTEREKNMDVLSFVIKKIYCR
jgi:hypothetical protein